MKWTLALAGGNLSQEQGYCSDAYGTGISKRPNSTQINLRTHHNAAGNLSQEQGYCSDAYGTGIGGIKDGMEEGTGI